MLVIVSDFHLSEGRRETTRKLAPAEDFFFDDEFARFLSYLNDRRPGGVHLIVNGDLFDFLQVGVTAEEIAVSPHLCRLPAREQKYICKYGAKTDETSSLFKLDKIAAGHQVFFDALGDFLTHGNKLTLIIGNHDIELFWPGVQDRFKALVGAGRLAMAGNGGAVVDIEFAPWIYYDHGLRLYVEHGHQYESLNSFRYPLYPVLPKKPSELNLPFGSLFVRYLLNKVEAVNPFADNIKPNTKYVAWALKTDPLGFRRLARLLWQFAVSVAKVFRRSGNLGRYSQSDIQAFEDETSSRLRRVAKKYGISGDPADPDHPLRKIRRLHRRPFNDGKLRLLWHLFFINLDVLLFIISGLSLIAFIFLVWQFGVRSVFAAASFLLAVIGALVGKAYYQAGSAIDKTMLAATRQIADILNDSGHPVKYVALGHTHQPEIARLNDDRFYFNTGTWGVIFNEEEELIREKKQFAFLLFDGPGEPDLMRWNDAVGLPELLPLFDARDVV